MKKTIIVTAGPTNEHIDAVMQITNMSTGALGSKVAEKLLDEPEVDKIYYISPKLARKPQYPFDDGRLHLIEIASTQDLLNTLGALLRNPAEHIDAIVHSAAVGDYKGRYAARAEDIAGEIAKAVTKKITSCEAGTYSLESIAQTVLSIMESPACVQDDSTKISSYEPNLMVMLDLTPKVIGTIKTASPDTMLIGFKLLEGVTNDELFGVASRLLKKNNADYIVANDLARIGNGRHWGMVINESGIVTECENKDEIAKTIVNLIFSRPVD